MTSMEATFDQVLFDKVDNALNSIRPYLEADGGNVRILEITDENHVIIELMGACGTCSMSAMTFKAGIEDAIRRSVPEITKVVAVNITPR